MSWQPACPIRTPRITLRPLSLDDLDDVYPLYSRPDVVHFLPWPVRDREESREFLRQKTTKSTVDEPGQQIVLAIESNESGRVVGEVNLR